MSWWHIATQQTQHKRHVADILKYVFSSDPVSNTMLHLCRNIDNNVSCGREVTTLDGLKKIEFDPRSVLQHKNTLFLQVYRLSQGANCMVCKLLHLEARALHTVRDMTNILPTYEFFGWVVAAHGSWMRRQQGLTRNSSQQTGPVSWHLAF